MENVTSPERVVFLGILFVLACVVIGLWLYFGLRGAPVDDTSTSELMRHAAHNALHWRPIHMSSGNEGDDQKKADVPPVVTTFTTAEQSIVTPNNEYNKALSDSSLDATAKSIAAMYQKGVITNLSKAICAAYGCTVQSSSKPDSTYQVALRAVNKYLPKDNAPQFRITPEQEAAREALGLNR